MATQFKKYRQQVQSVDAGQYDGSNQADIIAFTGGLAEMKGSNFVLKHPGGGSASPINATDWVIKDAWNLCECRTNADFQIIYAPGPS